VVDLLRVHRLDETEIVHDRGRVWHQIADPGARLAVLCELELRGHEREGCLHRRHRRQPLPLPNGRRKVAAGDFRELGLVVEEIEVRRPARLKQVDDTFGARGKMRQARRPGHVPLRQDVLAHQLRQRGGAEAGRGAEQEVSSIHGQSFVTVSSRFRIRLATVA
jgi:endonuclease/exonuclease/phosphatase family metal-dependent hydrolase